MWKLAIVLSTFGLVSCRFFDNPVLDYMCSSVVKYNGLYYATQPFSLTNLANKSFNISVSHDLVNWRNHSTIFNSQYYDILWSYIQNPEINVIGDGQFRMHFLTLTNGFYVVNAAFATDILGPYYGLDLPLTDATGDARSPTLLNADGAIYLTWSRSEALYRQRLWRDGLGLLDRNATLILSPGTSDFSGSVKSFSIIRHGYYYTFYSGANCLNNYGIGVARSLFPKGPFEKKPEPLVVADSKLVGPVGPIMVKDLDDVSDVLLFSAWKSDYNCSGFGGTWAKSLFWDSDGWPYVTDY